MNTQWNPEVLFGRYDRWHPDYLPGLHLDVSQPNVCICVFEGMHIPIYVHEIDPADIYGSVYRVFRQKLCDAFVTRDQWVRYGGSAIDCERMAEKTARKCERLDMFQAWLVLSI